MVISLSSEKYIPEKYITTADAFDSQGISEVQQKTITAEERKRYSDWTRQANDLIETELFPDSDVIPLEKGTQIFTYAKDACIHWITYKRRSWLGSINAKAAKEDYHSSIKLDKALLQRLPTAKTIPIQEAETTDFGRQYQIGFSQSQGFPTDLLY